MPTYRHTGSETMFGSADVPLSTYWGSLNRSLLLTLLFIAFFELSKEYYTLFHSKMSSKTDIE